MPITPLPLDMKVDKIGEKEASDKLEGSSPSSQGDYGGRGQVLTAPRGQSSPHLLASPQPYERSSDSPQVKQ